MPFDYLSFTRETQQQADTEIAFQLNQAAYPYIFESVQGNTARLNRQLKVKPPFKSAVSMHTSVANTQRGPKSDMNINQEEFTKITSKYVPPAELVSATEHV